MLNENVHGLEMQVYEKKLHLSSLLERAGEELGLEEDVLVAEYGPDVPVPPDSPTVVRTRTSRMRARESGQVAEAAGISCTTVGSPYVRAQQRARLEKAERKLGQLGRVNPLALEEFAALEQRHKFLTEQLADLTATRKDLLTIIDEIDEKMQDIFAAAFDDTRAAFNQVFPVLFPGGSGSLHLTDPENLLTTGIEVTVRPAGKKIERLSLLSGGERSLAAVALLIAIFKARPSPFYILDEVEAALDDANLGRLLTVLEDLRSDSPAHRHHAPEAHHGDRRCALRRLDAAGRRERRRRAARDDRRGTRELILDAGSAPASASFFAMMRKLLRAVLAVAIVGLSIGVAAPAVADEADCDGSRYTRGRLRDPRRAGALHPAADARYELGLRHPHRRSAPRTTTGRTDRTTSC